MERVASAMANPGGEKDSLSFPLRSLKRKGKKGHTGSPLSPRGRARRCPIGCPNNPKKKEEVGRELLTLDCVGEEEKKDKRPASSLIRAAAKTIHMMNRRGGEK